MELSSHACGDPSSPGVGAANLPPCPPESSLRGLAPLEKLPLELSTHACGDPSSPGAGGANLPPCPPESCLRGAAASPEPPPHGRRTYTSRYILVSRRRVKGPSPPETSLRGRGSRPRRARGRGALPGPPRYPCGGWRFDPSCVLPNPTGRPGNTRGEARRPFFRPYLVLVPDPSSHGAGGLGLIPRPPESSLRGLAPLEKPPLELSSHACGDPSSPRAGGANLPPCPPESSLRGLAPLEKPPLELSTHACGDPSSPGAGAANLPPCPPESSLRGAAASPEPPTAAGRIRPGMYWYPDGG
ncbi:hypothetical protein ROHU_028346 [Labeo rohita]|uniref:Uncharacterized protein n=1 Tax=Labeo rohita TaxID=84645 RepID=A0A498M6Y3_LABRO|nr:hypothetical protein ROHU_028326 [Labeo rohita]RXN15024.1 hypothetical protein ROHU_028346 [Labeo rohita]